MKLKVPDALSAISQFEARSINPKAGGSLLDVEEMALGRRIPEIYRDFLSEIGNGGCLDDLDLFPVQSGLDRKSLKLTWNSLRRNNDPQLSMWFFGDPQTFANFFVFGARHGACFCLKYADPTMVWIWEPGSASVIELDHDFVSWLNATAKLSRLGQ